MEFFQKNRIMESKKNNKKEKETKQKNKKIYYLLVGRDPARDHNHTG
jgi:hypothetical protein